MTQEEKLEALKHIRWSLQIVEEKLSLRHTSDALQELRGAKLQLTDLIEDAAKGEVTKPKTKTRIVNFAANDSDLRAYNETARLSNKWLDANPDAEIIDLKSALAADAEWSEHCITLAVRVPA